MPNIAARTDRFLPRIAAPLRSLPKHKVSRRSQLKRQFLLWDIDLALSSAKASRSLPAEAWNMGTDSPMILIPRTDDAVRYT
jgi:hypothetical protein